MLDDRTGQGSAFQGEFVWTAEGNRFGWSSMLGDLYGRDDASGYAVPARAEHLGGLPPTFLSIGALDLFVGETLNYAHRLIAAGVPTELHVIPGAYHGSGVVAGAAASIFAEDLFRRAVRRAIGSTPDKA